MIGSGTAGKICALDLAGDGHHVTLLSRPGAQSDYPVVIPEPALMTLEQRMPHVIEALLRAGAHQLNDADVLSQRFQITHLPDQNLPVGMLCLSARAMDEALEEIVCSNPLITIVAEPVIALTKNEKGISGVRTAKGEYSADLVIDTSGTSSQRGIWLAQLGLATDTSKKSGPVYTCYTRNYECPTMRSFFRLFSKSNWRGGIYPIGTNRFAVSIFTIQTHDQSPVEPTYYFDEALKLIATSDEIKNWRPVSDLTVIENIQRKESDFFASRSQTRNLKGFLPLGDSLFTSNPIYGRSLTSILLQTAALKNALGADNIWAYLHAKMPAIYNVTCMGQFRDFADESGWGPKTLLAKFLKRYYHFLLEPLESHDPEYYKTLLDVYQMRKNPAALAHPKFQWRSIKHFFSKAG